jgi:SCP-2 sterol transfer family
VAKQQFLSDEWFAAAAALVDEHGAEGPQSVDLVMNIIVTDTPFGEDRHLHLTTRSGSGSVGSGLSDDADATITADYETAKEVFASGKPDAAIELFMAGRVRIQGDLAKLLAAQASGSATANVALLEALHGITE